MADNVLGTLFGNIAAAIREKNGEAGTMKPIQFPEKIRGIEGKSPELRWVTFMSYDGLTEYGKKAVAVGDDCADPIARDVFDTPTRESTEQYNYTFAGWSTVVNGGLDTNALKAVEEDRTVYANFAAVTRYYTITYYDDDGSTVLKTQSLAYGAMPSYTPTKTGYTFTGWDKELAEVTEDASYTATWIAKLDFNTLSWTQIGDYAKSGQAAELFDLGAEKVFTVGSQSVTARIIGFNHDDLSDGTGKAGITLIMKPSCGYQGPGGQSAFASQIPSKYDTCWDASDVRSLWNNTTTTGFMMTSELPADLRRVIKQVKKKYYNITNTAIETTDDYIWLPSLCELGYNGTYKDGDCYAYYTPDKDDNTAYPELIMDHNGTAVSYHTRSKYASGYAIQSINLIGKKTTINQGSSSAYTFACFCI